jgi:phage terminase large subunit GpA-like protein
MDFLRFNLRRDDEDRKAGFVMRWPKDDPSGAHFVCPECGCVIDETSKRTMIEAGEWRAEREFVDHASFHIWAAYSLSPNASWCQIATEFIEAKKRPDTLKTFVNTVLGETWKDLGEAPDWELVKQRRESYPLAKVPDGVVALTCGVDVQKDRFIYEVVGWAPSKESWSVDAGQLHGDTSHPDTWKKLDELLDRVYPSTSGDLSFQIAMMAIDSGYNAQVVYNWVRRKPSSRVIAVKGVSSARVIIGSPTKVDVTVNGKKLRRGTKVWPVGVDIAKGEFYGWLGLRRDAAGEAPPGYCHFPEYGDEFFQQITAEHLVTIVGKRGGRTRMVWSVQANRENHYLDCRVYARAAVNLYGIDRMQSGSSRKITTKVQQLAASLPPVGGSPAPTPVPAPTPQQESIARPTGNKPRTGFWNKGAPRAARPGGWFSKRR